MTLRTLNYGNYGIFLIMGHAGFCPSTVGAHTLDLNRVVQVLLSRFGTVLPGWRLLSGFAVGLYGSFRKLGAPCFGVLIIRILLFRVLY